MWVICLIQQYEHLAPTKKYGLLFHQQNLISDSKLVWDFGWPLKEQNVSKNDYAPKEIGILVAIVDNVP